MGGLFSKPKPTPAPAVEPAPPAPEEAAVPDRTDEQVAAAAADQKRRYYNRARGRASSLLTGSTGVSEGSQSSAVRLLGGSGGV